LILKVLIVRPAPDVRTFPPNILVLSFLYEPFFVLLMSPFLGIYAVTGFDRFARTCSWKIFNPGSSQFFLMSWTPFTFNLFWQISHRPVTNFW